MPTLPVSAADRWLFHRLPMGGAVVVALLDRTGPGVASAIMLAALLPLCRETHAATARAMAAGLALGAGIAWAWTAAALLLCPVLLLDRRRWLVLLSSGVLGFALALLWPAPPWPNHASAPHDVSMALIAVIAVAGLWHLVAYVRLRRRGLMAQDRSARLLLGCLAAMAALFTMPAPHGAIALGLAGTAVVCMCGLSRPILPPHVHRRLWAATGIALAVSAVAQAL